MAKKLLIALLAIIAAVPLLAITGAPEVSSTSLRKLDGANQSQLDQLSVLTYNVKGLPWPVATGREEAFKAIESRLGTMRIAGKQPRIVVLQEAFTERAKQIGARSGYRYSASGPSAAEITAAPTAADTGPRQFVREASIFRGESEGKWLDSGLMIFSDYPIVSVKRAAFPASVCAGFDCLANKGALLVEIQIPGKPVPVTLITTHLNSRRGARVSEKRSLQAYKMQVAFLSDFVDRHRKADSPLIISGDFNASSPARRLALVQAPFLSNPDSLDKAPPSGLNALFGSLDKGEKLANEAAYIAERGRDWQFYIDGSSVSIEPKALRIPFGREADGTMLSDHLGFSIVYDIAAKS